MSENAYIGHPTCNNIGHSWQYYATTQADEVIHCRACDRCGQLQEFLQVEENVRKWVELFKGEEYE